MAPAPIADASRPPLKPNAPPPIAAVAPASLYEQGLTLAAMGFHEDAIRVLREIVAHASDHAPAWQKLAELLRLTGNGEDAAAAASQAAGHATMWPAASDGRALAELDTAERAMRERVGNIPALPGQLKSLRAHLRDHETDVTAMRLLARREWKGGELTTAHTLLERALVLAPGYEGARADLALLLRVLGENGRAAIETGRLVAQAPANVMYRALHADALLALGDIESTIPILEQLIEEEPAQARFRCVYAQTLHFAGRQEDSVREFRTCLELQPGMGEAYWGLAELRGNILTADDIAALREHLRDTNQEMSNRLRLQYALGRALEEADDFSASFTAYEEGAALLRAIAAGNGETYNSAKDAERVRRRRAVFTAPLLAARPPQRPIPEYTPIFVVGMPHAGSTLVEQILASHSLVEATMEMPVIRNITRDLSRSRPWLKLEAYPECVPDLTGVQLAELGAHYIEQADAYRKTKSPYFVDKTPPNWLDAGLIHMILPHAKIIDIRREPMASCFAMYKQRLADDATFPYEFDDLAHYYTQYVGMMAHYGSVMPGRIHSLSYERLVEDPEAEIRRLLDYCGLPFEEGCLRFWETRRVVATPSAEQVRRPIFRDALPHWRNFDPWLGPLKQALEEAKVAAAAAPQPSGYELALTLAAMSMYEAAIEELRVIVEREPTHPGAWLKLAEFLRLAGEDKEVDEANAAALRHAREASKWQPARDTRAPAELEAAERKLQAQSSRMDRAGQMEMLREHLLETPTDAAATHMLSRLEWDDDDKVTSQKLLERTLDLAPSYHPARAEFALQLMHQTYFVRALEQTQMLLRQMPGSAEYRAIHSDALRCLGDLPAALAATEELLREYPRHKQFWFGYGLLLHSLGRREDSARAFRTCLDIAPNMGEAYWGLADLKGGFLTEADEAAMRSCLADAALEPSSRMYMYYALGPVLESRGDFSASFTAYQKGARLFRGSFLGRGEAHREEKFVERVRSVKRVFTARNLTRCAVSPAVAPAARPIFIVGMPRAGSTLLEQILASHSQVEATRELPTIRDIIRDLAHSRVMISPDVYPECVADITPAQLAALGERYLGETSIYRKTERPCFIDKRPWNWLEAGLIHLILPHARIIDICREPMAACFAMFKQVFTDGADFSYDLHDLGRYYTEYAGLMDHWQSVMPGRIHFVQYERLVEDTESEIRRLLDYCGLPFEEGCLRFWETDRAISTPSAEQVRRPIFRDALQQWRNFEPWLGPLKEALSQPARA